MQFKIGQILNSEGQGIYGKLIGIRNRLIYGKEHNWTHSAIIADIKEDEVLVYEALSKGFVANSYMKLELEEKIKKGLLAVGQTKVQLKNVRKYAEKYKGTGYGFLDIAHIILYWIFGTEAKLLFTGAQNLICSEAVARILYDASGKKVNFEKEFGTPYDLIEPMHLWQSTQIKWLSQTTLVKL